MDIFGKKRVPDWVNNSIGAMDKLIAEETPELTVENLIKFLTESGIDVVTRYGEFPAVQSKLEALLKEKKTNEEIKAIVATWVPVPTEEEINKRTEEIMSKMKEIDDRTKKIASELELNKKVDEIYNELMTAEEKKIVSAEEIIKNIQKKKNVQSVEAEIEAKRKEGRKAKVAKLSAEQIEEKVSEIEKEVIKNRLKAKLKIKAEGEVTQEIPKEVNEQKVAKEPELEETREFKERKNAPDTKKVQPKEEARTFTPEEKLIQEDLDKTFAELSQLDNEVSQLNSQLEEELRKKEEEFAVKLSEKTARSEQLMNKAYDVLKGIGMVNKMVETRKNVYYGIFEEWKAGKEGGETAREFSKEKKKELEQMKEAKKKLEAKIKKFKEENGKLAKLVKVSQVFVLKSSSPVELKAAEIEQIDLLEKIEEVLKNLFDVNKEINQDFAAIAIA